MQFNYKIEPLTKQDLKEVSLNYLKLFFDNPKLEKKTLKQIFGDRKALRKAMQEWV